MVTQELLSYIQSEKQRGVSSDITSKALLASGWKLVDIDEAFKKINAPVIKLIPTPEVTPIEKRIPQEAAKPVGNLHDTSTTGWMRHSEIKKDSGITKKKHVLLKIIITIVLLMLLTGGGYAYYTGYFTNIETVAKKSFVSFKDAQSLSFDTTITIDMGESAVEEISFLSKNISLTSKGSYDVRDSTSPSFDSTFSFSSGSTLVKASMRFLNETLYAKIDTAPLISLLPSIDQYIGKWYSFNIKNDQLPSSINPLSSVGVNKDVFEKLTDEQKNKITELTRDADIIQTDKRLLPEEIAGVLSHHFTFSLNKDGIKTYAKQIEEYVHEVGKDDSYLSSFSMNDITESIDNIQNFSGTAWISKKDNLLQKVTISFDVSYGSDRTAKVQIISLFTDWNTPKNIQAPEESTTFQDLMESSLDSARQKGNDASIKAQLANTRAEGEIYYDKNKFSYYGFCKSTAILNTTSAVNAVNPGALFACKDGVTRFAVSAKLSTGEHFCVDHTSFADIKTTGVITAPSCTE